MTGWQDLFTPSSTRLPAVHTGSAAAPGGGVTRAGTDPWQQWWAYARTTARTAQRDPAAAFPRVEVYGPV
jgi:hypothetical protein